MLNEAKTSRSKPELRGRGWGQFLEVEAKAEANNNYEKVPNNELTTYDLRLLPEKLTKFPNFTRFLPKNAQLHNMKTRSRPGQGQIFDAEAKLRGRGQIFEAEAKILAPVPFWPRWLNITALHT